MNPEIKSHPYSSPKETSCFTLRLRDTVHNIDIVVDGKDLDETLEKFQEACSNAAGSRMQGVNFLRDKASHALSKVSK